MKSAHTEVRNQDAKKQRRDDQAASTKIQTTDVAYERCSYCKKRDWTACRVTNVTYAAVYSLQTYVK